MSHKLVLLRHGQSAWNLENRFTGWVDVPLSDAGRLEAASAGDMLSSAEFHPQIVFTSVLDRAIHTSQIALRVIGRSWLPVHRSWRLNERHYGALQGLDKAETSKIHGQEQVKIWRRSFDVPPPPLDASSPMNPSSDERYSNVEPGDLPTGESLELTRKRVMPYFQSEILPTILSGQSPLVVAHGNSLRSIVMSLDDMTTQQVLELNIPTGIPLQYTFDDSGKVIEKSYLGDSEKVQAMIDEVANQGAAQ